ncbi:MAG: reprolysin-like metallopeptidase, partial [Ferruginibacter sp.]
MTKIYKLLSVLILFCTVSLEVSAQRNFFNDIAESAIKNQPGKREIIPQKFRTTKMDINGIKSFLWSLASEKNINQSRSNASVLELPMPNGKTAKFSVWESSIQEPGLQAKFPEIKTFSGQGIDDPYATIRFDFTDFGFHAQIISAATGNIYIDPYKRGNKDYYISYFNRDNIKETNWHCETLAAAATNGLGPITNVVPVGACRGTQLYTYRLAVACTGEYAIAVGGSTQALLHSAIVTTVNRVDGVYENEFAIRLVLIANNNLIEFLNPSTDPFTGNNNGNVLISQSQTVIDANIGNANYDVGHTFSTGGGGLSGVGINCKTGQKARSITGSPNPTGDGYDIDYVAHEMGHAFGCDHTFNSVSANCGGGNRNAATAYEVGSGTTIMAYAGICSTSGSQAGDNTQNHSDPYFHSVSFDEASVYVAGAGGSCPVKTNTGNTLPVITSMGTSGLTIPINTPFVLTGSATDADGDALTYDWEEWDLGPTTVWNGGNANTTSPLFKSQIPKTSGSRSFPSLAYILAGFPVNPPGIVGGLKGETLPTSARTMQFRLTVRDNRAGGGGVVTGGSGCSTFNTPFTVDVAGTTAFTVSSPNGGESYPGGSSQTITWDVAGTSIAPFNVTNVKISYSTDGGLTYPTVLAASTPNDGSEILTIPIGITTTARIKIEAVGNIFYDISNANFAVTIPANDFVFGTTTAATVSCPAATDPAVTIPTTVTGTFVTPIILTATAGVPAGTSVSFAPSTITPGNSAVATLNNAGTLSAGSYTVTVTGTAGTIVHTTTITFIISAGTAPTITTQPVSTVVCGPAIASFTVASSTPGVSYQWQSAPSAAGPFTNISAANAATYTTGATSGLNGTVYHVIIFTQCGTVTSSNATLTVNTAAAITTQPTDQSAC